MQGTPHFSTALDEVPNLCIFQYPSEVQLIYMYNLTKISYKIYIVNKYANNKLYERQYFNHVEINIKIV